jgi:hypothetical protein
MKTKRTKSGLGDALFKAKNKQKAAAKEFYEKHKVEELETKPKVQLESVTERDTLAEFLYTSELAQKKFNVG